MRAQASHVQIIYLKQNFILFVAPVAAAVVVVVVIAVVVVDVVVVVFA